MGTENKTKEEQAEHYVESVFESSENWVKTALKETFVFAHELGSASQNTLIAEQAEDITRLKGLLLELADEIGKDYRNECDEADWYNNNMPGVGQTLQYKSRPPKPKALELIDNALNK